MIFFEFICSSKLFSSILVLLVAPGVYGSHFQEVQTTDFTVFQDFKAVLMYFTEAFLQDAKFGNENLEGETVLVTPAKFIHILEKGEKSDQRLEPLLVFRKQLQSGLEIARAIEYTGLIISHPDANIADIIIIAKAIQNLALQRILDNDINGIIIPSGWVGHATAMIIKPAGTNCFNLTVINSGQGLHHHYTGPDPDNVYPHLSKLWIEFENIPHELIFNSETAWLIYALASIKNPDFAKNIKASLNDGSESLPNYFYGSLLANFRAYLVVPQGDNIRDRLVPEQQSGSCAMSSLMGSLLYYSDSLKTFHRYRLKIGHILLETFLSRLGSIIEQDTLGTIGKSDAEFLNVLTDGFYSNGSKHFFGLIRALANHQLQYLEHEFPEEFKNAGLIGSGRSTWLNYKKDAAIETLLQNEYAMDDIRLTLKLAKSVHEITLKLKFRSETTHIRDLSQIHDTFSGGGKIYLEQRDGEHDAEITESLTFSVADGGNIYQNLLSGKPERLEIEPVSIEIFDQFYSGFLVLFSLNDYTTDNYFMRFLDIFRDLHAGKGWEIIHTQTDKEKLLVLQRSCKVLALRFAQLSNSYESNNLRKVTMDEITLLGHFQLLSWNLFKAIHKLQFPNPSIDWENVLPPRTIQLTLLEGWRLNSGSAEGFSIKSFNSIDNYKLYQIFIETESIDQSPESGMVVFPGPESYKNMNAFDFQKYMENAVFREIMGAFSNVPVVNEIWNELKDEPQWAELSEDHAKFLFVMYVEKERLFPVFQHYYNLMSTLLCLEFGAKSEGIENIKNENEYFWIKLSSHILFPKYLKPKHFDKTVDSLNPIYIYVPGFIFEKLNSVNDLFYFFRHSNAHPEEFGFTDVDTWFNYIKNAKSSKIFDSSYFQHMTDHFLNFPKYLNTLDNTILLFNKKKAQKIALELIKLAHNTIKELHSGTKIMNAMRCEKIVRRAVNISVITTRFISRMDLEFKDEAIDSVVWASLLARLYNTIEPYSDSNSSLSKLSDSDVSMLNFALSHMCYTYLSVPETFIKSVELRFKYPYKRNRKTLARLHWFLAKINYLASTDKMIADDQFKYGFLGSPLRRSEIRFFESLLKEKFLRNFLRIDSKYEFLYEAEGYVVKIIANSPEQDPRINILINLATGGIIENGHMIINKSVFVNSFEFQKYFPCKEHNFLSSKGKAFVFFGVPVFLFPTFKGSNYVLIQFVDKFWLLRKWKDNWYIWIPEEKCAKFMDALNYNWADKPIKMFKKYKSDIHNVEMIIFDDGAKDPIVKIIKNLTVDIDGVHSAEYRTVSFQLSIPGLTDGVSGKIINPGNYLESHLNAFAEEGVTVARQESDGTLIVLYSSYRLQDDPTRPLVLTSSTDYVIRVQNIQGMEIIKDQRIEKDGSGLPGSLVATFDRKKILLLPFAEVIKRSEDDSPQKLPYIIIEKIPIVEVSSKKPEGDRFAVPEPQSRMHRLLLAYHMILAQHYDSARRLLHPSMSFHHNEAFSEEELKITLWILRIAMKAPEFQALCFVVYSHFLINEAKFTFEYERKVSKNVEKLKEIDATKIFEKYMMSIRELPEKYYFFKIFPEISVAGSTLSRAFFEIDKGTGINDSGTTEHLPEKISFPTNLSFIDSGCIAKGFGTRRSFESLVHLMNVDSTLHPEINLVKYLLVRNNSRRKFDKNYEMAMFCYILNPSIWSEFKEIIGVHGNNFLLRRNLTIDLFNSTISQCQSLYSIEFEGAKLAHLSESTDHQMIRETMINDLGMSHNDKAEIMDHIAVIDTQIERSYMLDFKDTLMNRIRESGRYNIDGILGFGFDNNLIGSSAVLTGLLKSIKSFISEKGMNHLTILKFTDEEELFSKLQRLDEILSSRIIELGQLQKTLLKDLTYMTTTTPERPELSLAGSLENIFSMMHHRKQKTFSDLYACYLRNSSSCIQKKFPQLDFEGCDRVQRTAVLFFSQQILFDYLETVQTNAAKFLASDSVPVDELLIFCYELEKISDFNTRILNPVIMNFEFRSKKYRLKSEQVADIDLLTEKEEEPDGNFKSVVIQRMMAAGKTLVLGTISVVMKALKGRGKLSILVPPSSLYQSNTSAMQNRTYQYFKKKGNNFSFPRLPLARNGALQKQVSAHLKNVIQIINYTIESRNYLILSPDHLQSFMNSYIEAIENAEILLTGDNYAQYSKIFKQFATIYQIFKTRTSIILDEIDMTMDPKKELNFPTDETETYNMTAAEMLADIIEFMLFDQSIKEAGLNIHSNNQAAMTEENYINCRNIVLAYIETQLKDETSIWRKFMPETSIGQHVMVFLKARELSYGEDFIAFLIEIGQTELANALIIVKTQLYLYLQEFLGGTVNHNYGSAGPLRSHIKYAVPYVAANTPSAGSVFADRWETLIKTILMISASPCSVETTKDIIVHVRKAFMAEYASESGLDVKTLPTFLNMKMILPDDFDILELDENELVHVNYVHRGLNNRSPAAIRIIYGYFIDEVLSKMEFPVDQITSNALHMTSMFASVQGYSGTIDNVNILPHRTVSAAAVDHDQNEKDNGGIALKLIQDFSNAVIPELEEESSALSANEMVSRFLGLYEANEQVPIHPVSAIIDTGAFFKNFKNRQVSEAIFHYFKGTIETVLYYEEATNQLEFIRGVIDSNGFTSFTVGFLDTTDPGDIERATQTGIDKRFTFYDQRHITGSDILQPKGSHAIMSAGPRVLLRDILQGTLRMRQFMTSQKVHLVITESVRKFYKGKIGEGKEEEEKTEVEEDCLRVSELLTLGALNEDEKQNCENERLAFGKIDAEIRSFVLDEISKQLTHPDGIVDVEKITNLYNSSRDLFVRSIRENPMSWLNDRKSQNTAVLLEQHVTRRLNSLSRLFTSFEELARYQKFIQELEPMYKIQYKTETNSLLKYLSEEIYMHASVTNFVGSEVLMQNQTQVLTLMDLDLEQLVEQKEGNLSIKFHKFDLLKKPFLTKDDDCLYSAVDDFFNLKTIYETQSYFNNSIGLTDGTEIGVTTDLVQVYEVKRSTENRFPIFSKYNLEGSHFLVFTLLENLNRPKVILLSPRHAAEVFKSLQGDQERNYNFWLCDLSGDIIISKTNLVSPRQNIFKLEELKPRLEPLIFDLLIFNGSFPQILANSELRRIYENDWMNINHFKYRATFLRLRMKVLQEKDTHIFEDDDDDYVKLKRLSSGEFLMTGKEISHTGVYSKSAINSLIQDRFVQEHPIIFDEMTLRPTSGTLELEQNVTEIFEPSNDVVVYNESCLDLKEIELEPPVMTALAEDEIIQVDYLEIINDFSKDESFAILDHNSNDELLLNFFGIL